MNANARLSDPPTSHEAVASINAHSPAVDKNAPSEDVLDSLLVAAKELTRERGNFTDKELRTETLPHLRLVHKVKCKDDTSRIRCVRKWLTDNVLPKRQTVCIMPVEGKRDGERLWKYVDDPKPQPASKQQDLF